MTGLSKKAADDLNGKVKGRLVQPGDSDFDEARTIWNAMIDRRPAVIVRCASAEDVPHAIRSARENGLEISIRGAGHNIAGTAICDGGMVIDFSNMKSVRVEAEKKRAIVEPGATLADFDGAVQKHGLATPVGINSTTGISGLTLGGGFGWLTRKYGMTVDNLVSADVVTADGETFSANADKSADLFWAIRGGGGNFGVVTRYEYSLHPEGPEILAGLIVFPFDQAENVLRHYREFVTSIPEELNVWIVLRQAPPLPFLPEAVHGKKVIVAAIFYAGELDKADQLIAPIRKFGNPHGEHLGRQPYVNWQQAFDPLLTPGARNYWKSHNFTELGDEVLSAALEYTGKLPSPQCEIFIGLVAGAPNRVSPDAMAYGHRDAKFVINVHSRWDEATLDDSCIGWARDFFKASAPYASSGAYVNFMTADEANRVAAAYGANYAKLKELKKKFDPDNVFHMNQNIKI